MPQDPTIIAAIIANDAKRLKEILHTLRLNKEGINALDGNQNSYFHIAAKRLLKGDAPSDFYILELLLEYGIDQSLCNKEGQTALEMGDVNVCDSDNSTPLISAICRNFPHLFEILIEYEKTDLNKPNLRNLSPLAAAAAYPPQPKKLLRLIEAGADIFVGFGRDDLLNPLSVAVNSYEDEGRENAFYEDISECINILLSNYAGICFSFYSYREATVKYNFVDKLILGANIDERLIRLNPSILKSIRTVDALEKMREAGTINNDELLRIRQACYKIARACENKDVEMHKRIRGVIEELDKKIKFHLTLQSNVGSNNSKDDGGKLKGREEEKVDKPLVLPPTMPPSLTEENDIGGKTKGKEKGGVFTSVIAFFKGSSSPHVSPADTSKTKASHPKRPQ